MFSITKDYSFPKLLADNLRKRYDQNRRIKDEPIHVSDLISSGCLRKHYYERKFSSQNTISEDTVFRFIRGESSERVITDLANIGAAQIRIESNGIIARPDILKKNDDITPSSFLVVELKDNATLGKRLEPSDPIFKSYLHQLLYYLVLTDIENGILSIKYSVPELIWYQRDGEGDHYIKPFNGKGPGIESWAILLSSDDSLRQEIKDEIIKRRDLFLDALSTNKVESLPRLTGIAKKLKCKSCPFIERCQISDGETAEAIQLLTETTVIDKISVTNNAYE